MSSDTEPSHPGRAGPEAEQGEEREEIPEPVGTLFLLMIYVIVLAGMWGTMYWILLSR